MRSLLRSRSRLGFCLLALGAGALPAAAAQTRPNIVLLFADDHAAHAVSAYRAHLPYGARLPETPNIDRLAAEGMLFTNAFVTNSICAPSRAAVLTGQYGHLNGVMTNQEPFHPMDATFPELLHAAGYQTALFGKWHLETEPAGFDHYEILTGQGPYYNPTLRSAADSARYTGYTPDLVTDRALAWLRSRRNPEKPFLLMLHFNAPHRYWDPGPAQLGLYRDTVIPEPATLWDDGSGRAFSARDPEMTLALDLFGRDLKLEAPAGLTPAQQAAWDAAYGPENAAFRRAGLQGPALMRWKYQRYITDYLRVVAAVDANVGRVLDYLGRSGPAGETVVVYTSDQGFFLGDHGWFDKRWMYEESLRTPLLVRWPGTARPGSVSDALVMNLDLAETFLDLAGVPVPATMQGRTLVPLLRGRTPPDWRDAVYYQYFEYPGWHMVHRQYGIRTRRYKLIHYYEAGEWELFDLARDPHELTSAYDDPLYAEIRRELEEKLRELRAHYRVPEHDPVPHEPFDPPPELRRPGAVPGVAPDTAEIEGGRASGWMETGRGRRIQPISPVWSGLRGLALVQCRRRGGGGVPRLVVAGAPPELRPALLAGQRGSGGDVRRAPPGPGPGVRGRHCRMGALRRVGDAAERLEHPRVDLSALLVRRSRRNRKLPGGRTGGRIQLTFPTIRF